MSGLTRRRFLKRSGSAVAALSFPNLVPSSAFGANERLTLAVVGSGGRGRHLARQFAKLGEARVAAACDVDSREARTCADEVNKAYAETACLVNMMAMRLKRKLTWDPKAERFVGDDEANRLMTPAMRAPWSLA